MTGSKRGKYTFFHNLAPDHVKNMLMFTHENNEIAKRKLMWSKGK